MSIWVLFDLDGTLVDNSEGITKSTQFALDSYGYPNQPMETLKKFIVLSYRHHYYSYTF